MDVPPLPAPESVVKTLVGVGFVREKPDFDVDRNPRPFLTRGCRSGAVCKAIIGPTWTTVWKLVDAKIIEEINSARSADPEAVRRLARRVIM